MSTLAKREVTVEEALAELRDMFPGATNTIIIKDERFSRRVSVKVGYRIAEYDNLDDCMTVVRKWHKEQSS